MRRVFIDTNVLLDLLLERTPWIEQSEILFSLADRKQISLLCCSLSFSTAIYIMQRKGYKREDIIWRLGVAKSLCQVTALDGQVIDDMLKSNFMDLEDAMQYFSARSFSADVIVTRNKSDFTKAEIPVLTPIEYLRRLQKGFF